MCYLHNELTDESKSFYLAVYVISSKIPYGKVVPYGHIAYLIGKPQNSRQVGSFMKHLDMILLALNVELPEEEKLDSQSVPWWRVVLSAGKISPRGNSGSEIRQAELLRSEDVEVLDGLLIDLETFGWFPDDVDY